MKRTILTAAAALLLAIPAVQAQKVNKDALLSKIEKSDEEGMMDKYNKYNELYKQVQGGE